MRITFNHESIPDWTTYILFYTTIYMYFFNVFSKALSQFCVDLEFSYVLWRAFRVANNSREFK